MLFATNRMKKQPKIATYTEEVQKKLLDYIKSILSNYKVKEKKKVQYKGRVVNKEIWIRKSLYPKEKCRTIAHEYGHVIQIEFMGPDHADKQVEKIAFILYPKRKVRHGQGKIRYRKD